MRRFLFACSVMLPAMILFTSCLGGDSDDTVYPSDAAITAFSLGTLKQNATKKSSKGEDSTYVASVSGSSYKFYIDQVNRLIYNPDSLPYGTDVAHVVCTISSKNSSRIFIKSVTSDSLFAYSSTDSIDFSQPRTFKVFSLDGKNIVDYTVSLNVRKVVADSLIWHQTTALDAFADAKGMKAVAFRGRIFVFVSDGDNGSIYSTDESEIEWQMENWNLEIPIPAKAFENVVVMGNYMYMYAAPWILRTTNGSDWVETSLTDISQLVAASSTSLYAIGGDGGMYASTDEGATWTRETLDSDAALLPTSEVSYCLMPSRINNAVENIVLVGNRSVAEYDGDTRAHVWCKVIDEGANDPWMYVSYYDQAHLALPRLSSLSTVCYNGALLAVGGQGLGACEEEGYKKIYYSGDGGIYWKTDERYFLPSGMVANDVFSMTVDEQNFLWLICGGSGSVWRGRINGGNETYQTSFTE